MSDTVSKPGGRAQLWGLGRLLEEGQRGDIRRSIVVVSLLSIEMTSITILNSTF